MAYTGVRTLLVMVNSLQRRRASAVLFSLITACLLGLGGLLVGTSLWRHFGPPAKDPDDTNAYLFGLLVGGLLAICGIVGSLWKFWPRAPKIMEHLTHKVEAVQLSTNELLKRMTREQAINLVQNILRELEESSNAPDIPATKIRTEKLLEELKRS
jgi:hypothetical protein